ncbi:MAG: hypothetical protein ACI85K_002643 [Hyphomicrobiaceae bacterium]|jgi:hypothetical protein
MIKLDLNPAPHIIKQFAWFAVIGMGLLGFAALKFTVGFAWDHPVFLTAIGIGVVQLLLFLVGVSIMSRTLFVVLSVAFVPIGFVLSHVMLAAIYYLVLTPIALVFRLIGRDVIGKKLDKNAKSYWHERSGDRPAASYFKLY